MWLTVLVCCSLAVSGTGFVLLARGSLRALRRLRRSPEDRVARFDYGWLGAFALMCGISSAMSLEVLVNLHVRSRWLAVVGLVLLNVLIQPVALMFGWVAVRRFGLVLFELMAWAKGRVGQAEFAGMPHSKRLAFLLVCAFQGILALFFGAMISLPFVQDIIHVIMKRSV